MTGDCLRTRPIVSLLLFWECQVHGFCVFIYILKFQFPNFGFELIKQTKKKKKFLFATVQPTDHRCNKAHCCQTYLFFYF